MNTSELRRLTAVWLSVLGIMAGAGLPSALAAVSDDSVDMATLRTRVDRLTDQVAGLVDLNNLLDTLHFEWFDRPYARATLATLVKTTQTLEREMRLRQHQNGAIADPVLIEMLEWADDATQRVTASDSYPGFRPHRRRITGAELAEVSPTPALLGIVDRTTATRSHPSFGDLDLAAAMGFRVYPRIAGEIPRDGSGSALLDRAAALGMASVVLSDANSTDTGLPQHALTVEPVTLQNLLGGERIVGSRPGRSAAIVDPAFGESWASSLARRAAARGVFERLRYVADGWGTLQNRSDPPDATSAALWVHALDGQSLGLVRGWRDLRDGSGSMYASLLTTPSHTEALSHTALDLIRLGEYLAPFRTKPVVAVAVGAEAVDPSRSNEWAAWIEPIWAKLLDRQLRFDVVRRGSVDDRLRRQYQVVVPLDPEKAADPETFLLTIGRELAGHTEHTGRATVKETGPGLAEDVIIREGVTPAGRCCVFVANLSDRPRELVLQRGKPLGAVRDLIAEEKINEPHSPLPYEPWQVRLLWPTG